MHDARAVVLDTDHSSSPSSMLILRRKVRLYQSSCHAEHFSQHARKVRWQATELSLTDELVALLHS
jgi:hypothetical protein